MSLTPLTNYKTLSDKRLLESFNDALGVMDANFNYTLGQVTSPVPGFSGIPENFVLAVGETNSSKTLQYKNVNNLVNLQTTFDSYTAVQNKLNLGKELEFSLTGAALPFSKFSITGRGSAGNGNINHYFSLLQTSTAGELNETHVVGSFAVTANSFNLTANVGHVSVNKLKVGNYTFPITAGTKGQILTLGNDDSLEFANNQSNVIESSDRYTLQNSKPLVLSSLRLFNLNSGIDTTITGGINTEVFFRFNNNRLLTFTAPQNPAPGTPSTAYVKVDGPLVLPAATGINSASSYEGSVWYDSSERQLVVMSATGPLYFKDPSANAIVNTDQAKAYNFNNSASINLGSGSAATPSFKVGAAGLFGNSESLNLSFNGNSAVRISKTHIEGATEPNGGAKVVLDSQLGMGNPQAPAYTFSGANQLGLYRSSVNGVGVAVQGNCVSEFVATGIDLKNKKISNAADPEFSTDVVNKRYVDGKLPTGSTSNSFPIYSSTAAKYVESSVKYVNGNIEVGTNLSPGGLTLKNSTSGSVTLKPGTGTQNTTLTFPSTITADGILRVNNQGQLYWGTKASIVEGLLKADGSIQLEAGLNVGKPTDETDLALYTGTTGIYIQEGLGSKIGFANNGQKLFEVDSEESALMGVAAGADSFYIKLTDSGQTQPIYGFTSNKNSGLGLTTNGLALIVDNAEKLTLTENNLNVNGLAIKNVANPSVAQDVATKAYVDNLTKEPVELSFQIVTLPGGWTTGNPVMLALSPPALIFDSTYAYLEYLPNPLPSNIIVPENFQNNIKCQCYVENARLLKVPKDDSIPQVSRINNGALWIKYNIAVGQIITLQLPG